MGFNPVKGILGMCILIGLWVLVGVTSFFGWDLDEKCATWSSQSNESIRFAAQVWSIVMTCVPLLFIGGTAAIMFFFVEALGGLTWLTHLFRMAVTGALFLSALAIFVLSGSCAELNSGDTQTTNLVVAAIGAAGCVLAFLVTIWPLLRIAWRDIQKSRAASKQRKQQQQQRHGHHHHHHHSSTASSSTGSSSASSSSASS